MKKYEIIAANAVGGANFLKIIDGEIEQIYALPFAAEQKDIEKCLSSFKGDSTVTAPKEKEKEKEEEKPKVKKSKPVKTIEDDYITFDDLFGGDDFDEATEVTEAKPKIEEKVKEKPKEIVDVKSEEKEKEKPKSKVKPKKEIKTFDEAQMYKFTFGKHKGQLMSFVASSDPEYLKWLVESSTSSGDARAAALIMIREAVA